jgi:hypothetical protein
MLSSRLATWDPNPIGKMAGPTVCETRCSKTLASFVKHRSELVSAYQGAEEDIGLIRAALIQIGSLIRNSPPPPRMVTLPPGRN